MIQLVLYKIIFLLIIKIIFIIKKKKKKKNFNYLIIENIINNIMI